MGAARSATAPRKRLLRRSRSVSARAQRRSRCRGSSRIAPRSSSGTAFESALKSAVAGSHSQIPSVTTGKMCSTDLVASQWVISLLTHSEEADSGEANKTNQPDSFKAASMADHRCGLVERPVSSRKMCRARRLFQGLARRSRPRWRAGANLPSAA